MIREPRQNSASAIASVKVLRMRLTETGEQLDKQIAEYKRDAAKLLERREELVKLAEAHRNLDKLCSEMESEDIPW